MEFNQFSVSASVVTADDKYGDNSYIRMEGKDFASVVADVANVARIPLDELAGALITRYNEQ